MANRRTETTQNSSEARSVTRLDAARIRRRDEWQALRCMLRNTSLWGLLHSRLQIPVCSYGKLWRVHFMHCTHS